MTTPLSDDATISSASGWSKPLSSTIVPSAISPQTNRK